MRALPTAQGVRLLLSAGSPVVLRPRGASMVPAIFPGDHVIVGPPRDVRVGDIVLLDGPRLHRVTSLDHARGTLVTRGDALHADDPAVPLGAVAAVVREVRPCWPLRARHLASRVVAWLAALRRCVSRRGPDRGQSRGPVAGR